MSSAKDDKFAAKEPPFLSELPQVSAEDAATLREQISQRTFVPSNTRPPEEVLPNPDFITIIDQGQEGVSVGVGLAAVLNYLRAEQGETELVSPRMLYEFARVYDEWPGTDYQGSSVIGGLAGLVRHGVCTDRQWPLYFGDNKSLATPSAQAFESALHNRPSAILKVERNMDHLRAAVFEHHAIVVSALLHHGWDNPSRGIIAFGQKAQQTIGGHAFAVIGYTPRGFIVQNSWGTGWGGVKLRNHTVGGLAIWTYDDALKNLTDAWVIQLKSQPYRAPLVGYDADSLEGDDLLEIKSEVNAFSYVLASRSIKPPLALGLFGDWGSGKSFFMQEMHKKIDSLAELSRNHGEQNESSSPFCSNIVQIRFNAWHYLDTDLWASLVTEIFDKLFQGIYGETGKPEEKLPGLSKELQSANGVYQQAKRQLDDAITSRANAEKALKDAINASDEQEGNLVKQLDDLGELLVNNAAVRDNVKQLAKDLGMPELGTSYQALNQRADEIKGLGYRFSALMQTMFTTPWGWPRMLTLIAALFTPVLVVMVIVFLKQHFQVPLDDFHSFAVQISSFFTAVAAWLGVQAKRGAGVLSLLENTQKQLQDIREQRRVSVVEQQQSGVQALKAREAAARKSLQEAEWRVQTLQREIQELQPGRLIMRFIEERSKSQDYRSRLGIVSLVRRDFERLSELSDPDSKMHNSELMPVQRIILYIDDLDRCRPDRVIEVLEAVHLLLAFRLFMVVVAVDPRWLRRCLEKHYPDLLVPDTQEVSTVAHVVSSRPATAQDYLEKIFQIPFTLQPLKDDGYRRLIQGLTELNRESEVPVPVSGRTGESVTQEQQEQTAKSEGGEQNVAKVTEKQQQIKAQAKQQLRKELSDEETAENNVSAIERLRIRAWELKDMERLAPLFHTPRSVKRFVNTYRFLRADVRPQYLARFEGTSTEPGAYRAAMTLLAIVISYSNVAPRFLKRVLDSAAIRKGNKDWIRFLNEARDDVHLTAPLETETPTAKTQDHEENKNSEAAPSDEVATLQHSNWEQMEWIQLCDKLLTLSQDNFPVKKISELEEWIYMVSRFSFTLASIATVDQRGMENDKG